ncbi:DUF3618 domain-containing protein [Marinobacter halophilus]|uniref:DUF3618 domain-containing protein n=1 Tax=Marinobacter halophilus TaxID=1323740 RepID=A0A2T1KBM0_9GAMM|nr:DUF3618 domain-containing protein [Marinobacter halophilus]PSF06932.1 hypothetical protein C7H08_17875 [Marinobacter halophilus]GGC76796.1 hypothetical protein GCM10011362_26770 [Marinobacter halophilus]
MTTAKEQFKNDLQKDPEDLAREADSVREDLEDTVDKLMNQLSPSELLNRGISMFRNTGDFDFVRNLVTRVENNPVPTVLAGVSLIWLMTASRQPSVNRGESFTDTMGNKAGATREKLSSATSSLKSSSHDAAERTREAGHQVAAGASNVMHRVSDAGRHTAESARTGLRDAREGYIKTLREQPLMVGVLAVAAGAALGALLPRTSTEDRVLGEWSDRGAGALKEKTEEKLHEAQGQIAPESEGRADASASNTPAQTTTDKPGSGISGAGGSLAGTGASQSDPKPPKLDPAPPR